MVVSRESHVHHVPQIGLAQIEPGDDHQRAEDHPGLGRRVAQVVPQLIAEPQVEYPRDRDQPERRERDPRERHVEIKNQLRDSLLGLGRYVVEYHEQRRHHQRERRVS